MTDARLDRIADLLTLKADGQYGLARITQLQHALQCAWLAEQQGCPDTLIVASLLHDVGHLVHDLGADPAARGVDDRHEEVGSAFLADWFGPEVSEPVRLHVAAKRYLCATEPAYFGQLSEASVYTLSLQGGPMADAEARDFEREPYGADAIAVRRWDDQAKDPSADVPGVDHYRSLLASLLSVA
jgi:phosphonate degradation associated HDIG domain protein